MLLILLIAAATLFIYWLKWTFSYWQRKGFPYEEPKIPCGALDEVRRNELSFGMAIYNVYKSHKDPVVGIYLGLRPALLVRDAHLTRDIFVKDFTSFHDRGVYIDESKNPMSGSLFAMKAEKWRSLRNKIAPAFTSGKLKGMFPTILDISNKMIEHLNGVIAEDKSATIELKNVFTIYAIDIIASVIFGLEVNSYKDPSNEFYSVSKQINKPNLSSIVRGTSQFLYPNLEKFFVWIGWQEEYPQRMLEIVRRTIEYREANNVSRKDMLQLLLQLRNTGKVNENDVWTAEKVSDSLKSISIESIAAQLMLFYIAGYETTAATISFTIYELAQYPELLVKAQADVKQALEKHGELSYEAIQDMTYLDLCVMETTRKYPALPILNRECTEDFKLPNSDKVITKGTPIIISLFGIHRDPEYFPDPLKYDPERFLPENMNYDTIAYMPFGDGPRHCIAQRMGKVNVKVALAQILNNFELEPKKEKREIEFAHFGVPIQPKGGVNVKLTKKV